MSKEKDFFKTCFNTVASLEVKNESQAIAKEVVLSEIEQLQQENNQLRLINKEHQQINGELRQTNKLLNEQYIRLYKEYEQQERIKYLERSNNRREDIILEQRQKINDLEDNWNKLKEYIRKNIIYDDVGMKILDPSPLEDYMQELEQGNDSNE